MIGNRMGSGAGEAASMMMDHEAAVVGIFDCLSGDRPLSTSYVKELHHLTTRKQATVPRIDLIGNRTFRPHLRGAYKRLPHNSHTAGGTVFEYCSPEHVASKLDRLIAIQYTHGGLAPEISAAWLHYRFDVIRPFQYGNGRVARMLASLVFVRAGLVPGREVVGACGTLRRTQAG